MQERWKRIGLMYGHCESTHSKGEKHDNELCYKI